MTGIGLFGLAWGCTAVTLGRAQGTAWIGSPLDFTVQVQFADGEEVSSACVEADVFHADARQDASRIRVTVEPGAQAQVGVVRVVSFALVDEPVVTVYLRAGCLQKSARRYVLLAELPNDVATPTPVPNANRLTALPLAPRTYATVPAEPTASRPPQPSPHLERKARPADDQTQAPTPDKRAYKTPAPAQTSNRVAPAANVRPVSGSGKSRLKLDLLDLVEEREVTLKSSNELSILPTDNLQLRSEAAALWRALNASPEDILRQAGRVQMVESEMDALKTLTAKNQQGLTELGAQIQKAEAERYANWLVYVLATLLLVMLVALALLWRRRVPPSDSIHWHSVQPGTPAPDEVDLDLDLDIPAAPAPAPADR